MSKQLRHWKLAVGASVLLTCTAAMAANDSIADITDAIRKYEAEHSEVMRTTHILADTFGPRLTGSGSASRAADWAMSQYRRWGLKNVHTEKWQFDHPGWINLEADGYLTAPAHSKLEFSVSAWTPSSSGTVEGQAVQLILPSDPTAAELRSYFASVRKQVAGRIVLIGSGKLPTDDQPIPYRFSDAELGRILESNQELGPEPTRRAGTLERSEINRRLDQFLIRARALIRVNDAHRPHGLISATRNDSYNVDLAVPSVTLRNEDFGRVVRLMADGAPVRLKFRIKNQSFPRGRLSPNVIAEIPGSDKADEVVMLGAHLDSWHLATGATDNAVGCAIVMEAVRILEALTVHPRRTIRIALWTGEEQGLLGSQDYVARHFGTAESPRREFAKLNAYLNIDGGTGRVRAVNVFGPSSSAAVLRQILEPLTSLGVAGAVEHRIRKLRGTDATTFSRAGLPAIGVIQDPIEYGSVTWHSNVDTYDAVLEDDARQASVVVAALAYRLAMQNEMLPRFNAVDMPPPQGAAPVSRVIVPR